MSSSELLWLGAVPVEGADGIRAVASRNCLEDLKGCAWRLIAGDLGLMGGSASKILKKDLA
jgi:hypothetical protein